MQTRLIGMNSTDGVRFGVKDVPHEVGRVREIYGAVAVEVELQCGGTADGTVVHVVAVVVVIGVGDICTQTFPADAVAERVVS